MISNQQIEAEIDELKAEIDRRFTAVKGMFAQVAELRSQADLLTRLLALRSKAGSDDGMTSSQLVGLVCNSSDAPTPICALTWRGSKELPVDGRIYVRREWPSLLTEDVGRYFSDLLADWKQRIRNEPAALVLSVGELSVGPVQILEEVTVRTGQLSRLLAAQLGNFDAYPELTIVK